MSRIAPLLLFLTALGGAAAGEDLPAESVGRTETQSHGVIFEAWLREKFFGGYQPESYTQKWDIPAAANREHGGLPVNPKAIKWGTPVDLGDALRQWEIAQNGGRFMLIVGFWEQAEPGLKRFVRVEAVEVTPELYRQLWAPITLDDLKTLDALVKDRSQPVIEVRKAAQALKKKPPFSEAVLQVNPKIDANQRRLQCSLRFGDFFHFLAPKAVPEKVDAPTLWGQPVPPIPRAARTLPPRQKAAEEPAPKPR